MPKYSNYVRTRIELLHNQGLHPAGILKTLKGEGLVVSLSGITRMIKKLRLTGSIANLPRSGRPRKLSVEARAFIDRSADAQEWRDDERQDPKEASQTWNFRELIHGTEIAKAARLDSAADGLLLADSWRQQSQAAGVRTTRFGEWRHFPQRDF